MSAQTELGRVFVLQQSRKWEMKLSPATGRRTKLARLKEAVAASADAIVATVPGDRHERAIHRHQ